MSQRQRLVGWQPRWETGRLRFDPIHSAPLPVSPVPTGGPVLVRPVPQVSITRGVIKTRKDTSHLFHLVMTIITGGAWAIVWLLVAIWHSIGPRRRSRVREETRTS